MPVCILLFAIFSGCNAPGSVGSDICARLHHEDPSVRIYAAIEAGNTGYKKAVPLLVDRLEDQDSNVRMFSAVALRKITGKDFGWAAWNTDSQRQEAVFRWRAWLKSNNVSAVASQER